MKNLTNWNEMNRDELRVAAKAEGLKVAGTKADLIARLADFELAGLENEHSDGHHDESPVPEICEACLARELAPEPETKATKVHATHRGGRSLIPGWSMTEARERAAVELAARVVEAVDNGADPDAFTIVEGILMDEADVDSVRYLREPKPAGDPVAISRYLVSELGKVLNEYLRQSRNDRYDYILVKVHQATGRELAKLGRDRKTGIKNPKGGK